MPWFNFNISNLINKVPLIIKKKFRVKKHIVKLILYKLAGSDANLIDMLSYARNLAMTN